MLFFMRELTHPLVANWRPIQWLSFPDGVLQRVNANCRHSVRIARSCTSPSSFLQERRLLLDFARYT